MENILIYGGIALLLYYMFKSDKEEETQAPTIRVEKIDPSDRNVSELRFKIVGVSYKNEDGSSRQENIEKYAKVDEPVSLKFYTYEGALACAVYIGDDTSKQVGHLPKAQVQTLFTVATDENVVIDPRIASAGRAMENDKWGMRIVIYIKEA